MVYYVDDMILEVVATLFSGSSNDILVCKDRRSPVDARYTLLVIRDKALVKTFISISEGSGKKAFFLKSFARNDELIYCFPYQEERRFSAFARGQTQNPAKAGEISARLVMECASSLYPSPLLYLILTQDNVHITRDNRIYFTPVFDLSQLDSEKTEADCTIRCAEIILELLECGPAKQTGSCELIRKKCRSNSYSAFPELYKDIRLTAMPGEKLSIAGASQGTHILEVQYNPSSISIQANSVVTPFQYLQQNIDNGIPAQSFRDPAVVLSVELYFDDMNPKDAFMIDKLRLSVGDAVSGVSGLVKASKGETYSVMPQTNGLLAALIRDKTRMVTFKWADMSFTGEMTEANASYTMFSVSGRPVRSVVKLSITQEVKAGDETYWTKAFDSAFGDETAAKTSGGRSFANRYGNLLNIGF